MRLCEVPLERKERERKAPALGKPEIPLLLCLSSVYLGRQSFLYKVSSAPLAPPLHRHGFYYTTPFSDVLTDIIQHHPLGMKIILVQLLSRYYSVSVPG